MRARTWLAWLPVPDSYLRHVASRCTYSPVCVVCENSAILTDIRYSKTMPLYLSPTSWHRVTLVPGKSPRSSSSYSLFLPTHRPHPHGKRSSSPSFPPKVKRGTRAGERTRRALRWSLSLRPLPVGRARTSRIGGGDIHSMIFLIACLRTWCITRRRFNSFFFDMSWWIFSNLVGFFN